MKLTKFAWFSWGLLSYNLLVILWGAYVRATGSGAGCGAHWPLCTGIVIPQAAAIATRIEFTHRVMSGLTVLGSISLFIWAFRAYQRGNPLRLGASLVLGFTISEALVGAGLVLFQLVAQNASMERAASVAVHLVNTLLLLGSITLTARWSSGATPVPIRRFDLASWLFVAGMVGVIILSAAGAVTAMGDTLFPSGSLVEGLQQDVNPTASFLIHLRLYHPLIAMIVGAYLFVLTMWAGSRYENQLRRPASILIGLYALQLVLGLVNVTLLAPLWMQMLHLFVSDLVWICLVLFSLAVFNQALVQVSKPAFPVAEQAGE